MQCTDACPPIRQQAVIGEYSRRHFQEGKSASSGHGRGPKVETVDARNSSKQRRLSQGSLGLYGPWAPRTWSVNLGERTP